MSVNSISSIPLSSGKPTQSAPPSSRVAAAKAAQQEATETAAQTAQEARNGDRTAMRKLQHLQSQKQQPADTAQSEGLDKGRVVDQHA
jgi:hypothetical protein